MHEVQNYMEGLLLENKTLTAKQRYWKLLETHPGVLQRIQLKYLASFLGIAPQSLSRIRKNYSKNDKS